ncbi:MAG: SAM-dependent methyltransferase [Betaproteobacteria bacterium]
MDRIEGRARAGDTVLVCASNGRPLARAALSPSSQIRARVWTFEPDETIDNAFFKRRVAASLARRSIIEGAGPQSGLRLIHGESDLLPGVIADRYGELVVIQLNSAGADKWRGAIVDALLKASGCARIYERSDAEVRALEGLPPVAGWAHAGPGGGPIVIDEAGIRLEVDFEHGHKTGFYLDQRDSRLMCRRLSAGRRVLNCFCYTGAFNLNALAGGAVDVLSIDSSAPALAGFERNLRLNPMLDAGRSHGRQADVFEVLRELKAQDRRFDLIILDPPKFAPSARHADAAARAYKDINLFGFRLLAPAGLLMTYSCSGGIGLELFQRIVADAAADAGVDARILARLQAAADHPVGLAFPEGEYLKGLLCQIDG